MHRDFLARLAVATPLLPGLDRVASVDVYPTHRRVYGRAKQGAEAGRFKGVRTLHPILAALSTPTGRPVIAAVRLRRGKAADARGAGPFTAEALAAAREAGAGGTVIVRPDSQFYNADVVAACHRARAYFSLTARMNPHVAAAISAIGEDAWTPIRYPEAFVDPDTGDLVSDAEVAETEYTVFTGRRKAEHATGRLIVRRVRRLNAEPAPGQGELFTAWRYHPVFTDSPFATLQAELHHRQHAVIEQVIADGKGSALAHLPSGDFQANNAWLTLWAIAHNLLRAAGALAGTFHARSNHRDPAGPPDPPTGPHRPLGPTADAAPTRPLALAARVHRPVPYRPPATSLINDPTTRPTEPDRSRRGRAGQTSGHPTPTTRPPRPNPKSDYSRIRPVDSG